MLDLALHDLAPLPPGLRAARPAQERGLRRDRVRLLVIDRAQEALQHTHVDALADLLGAGDVVVVNDSRTLPAALDVTRDNGAAVQLRLCVRHGATWDVLAVDTRPPHANVALAPGERLGVAGEAFGVVRGHRADIPFLVRVDVTAEGIDPLLRHGYPIRYSYVPDPVEAEYYQTVYATHPGSAEPPSAGLPLSWELLRRITARGAAVVPLTLHTGLSSFQDDAFDAEHHLYEEWFDIPRQTAEAVAAGTRVVAVGTTVVRALETAATESGRVEPGSGWTTLRIHPNSRPRVVDALLTGMHEPQASHFELLEAFAPPPLLRRAFEEAVERRYLWHEFGDSMLIV